MADAVLVVESRDSALAPPPAGAPELVGVDPSHVHAELGECLLALDRAADARPYFAHAYRLLSREPRLAARDREWLHRLAELGQLILDQRARFEQLTDTK